MSTAETNLQKLAKSCIPMNFVKKNKGEWDHQKWLDFCESIKVKGYDPVNLDEVGLILENKKSEYFAKACGDCCKPKKAAKKAAPKKAAAKKAAPKKTAAKKK